MDLILGNPAGLWALLGLPAVIAIHFLQRRSRVVTATTLFLLEPLRRESETGRRLERLRTSIPLWLQLLAVLLLAWLLAEPRWLRAESVQRVAVVMDDSASMQAFRSQALAGLGDFLRRLGARSARLELTVLRSSPEAGALYHGSDPAAALREVESAWSPWLGLHDFHPALRTGRALVGDGLLVLISDHVPERVLPHDAALLAVGRPLPNCGVTGVAFDPSAGEGAFRVMVKNFSSAEQSRQWWLEIDGRRSAPTSVLLPAGGMAMLQSALPAGADEAVLTLEPDDLPADDRVPLVRPLPKSLGFSVDGPWPELQEMLSAFPQLVPAGAGAAELTAMVHDPLAPARPDGHAVVFTSDPQPDAQYLAGPLLVEDHPLMAELNWQPLLVQEGLGLPRSPQDHVLLWQGERPLILLRRAAGGQRQLLFNIDLRASNLRRLPAFPVLLHRFFNLLLEEKAAFFRENYETGQRLTVAGAADGPPPVQSVRPLDGGPAPEAPVEAAPLRAPLQPAFFTVSQDGRPLLQGAAHFTDPRESDLSAAASADRLQEDEAVLVERLSREDDLWRLWLLLLLAALLLSWHFSRERARPAPAPLRGS